MVPILTRYEGVSDCFSTILQEEGFSGLFKGFGAVILQYAVHFLIIKFSSKIISQIAQVFSNPRLFPQDSRLPAVPDVSTEMNSTSSTSSLRGSPKLQPSISGSPSPIRRAANKNVTNSTERPSFLSMDKEIPSAEDPTSKGAHENDNTVSKNSGMLDK